jgi:hypothetical protein
VKRFQKHRSTESLFTPEALRCRAKATEMSTVKEWFFLDSAQSEWQHAQSAMVKAISKSLFLQGAIHISDSFQLA